MSEQSIFEVTPDQLAGIDAEGLRLLIAKLCEAELRRKGLPATAVIYGGDQIAADGGIDVRVDLPGNVELIGPGPIPRPATGFQAKADDMPASEITKEMCPLVRRPDGQRVRRLRQSIADLAANSGAYIIVSSKGSVADARLLERRAAMSAAVAGLAHNEALYLDFYDRTRMATWVNEYPGVVLWVRIELAIRFLAGNPLATGPMHLRAHRGST